MIRKVIYRAWDKKYKVMLEGFAIYSEGDSIGMSVDDAGQYYTEEEIEADSGVHFGEGDDWIFVFNDFELMLGTGFKDSENIEVFDGDICKAQNGKMWVVVFDKYGWRFSNKSIKDNGNNKFGGEEDYDFDWYIKALKKVNAEIKVIGNFWENPELLTSSNTK